MREGPNGEATRRPLDTTAPNITPVFSETQVLTPSWEASAVQRRSPLQHLKIWVTSDPPKLVRQVETGAATQWVEISKSWTKINRSTEDGENWYRVVLNNVEVIYDIHSDLKCFSGIRLVMPCRKIISIYIFLWKSNWCQGNKPIMKEETIFNEKQNEQHEKSRSATLSFVLPLHRTT